MTEGERRDRSAAGADAVLEAASRLFMAEGYAKTRMERVATAARVSTATLYVWFPGKSELFRAVVRHELGRFGDSLEAAEQAPGDRLERFRRFAGAYARFMSDPVIRAFFRLIAAERRQFPELADCFYRQAHEILGARLRRMLAAMCAEGLLDLPDLAGAARQLQGMLEHSTLVLAMMLGDDHAPDPSPEAIADEAVATFLARYGRSAGI